jgi:hypothetical protein
MVNEIRSVIKNEGILISGGELNERGFWERVAQEFFIWNILLTDPLSRKSSLQKFNRITK